MKKLEVAWKGVTPLIMHSCRCVNPLHPLAKGIKVYTNKRKKTDEDYEIISNFEWLMGAYYTHDTIESPFKKVVDDHRLYIPSENLAATIKNGAKANKRGTDIERFVMVTEPMIYLNVLGNPDFKKMMFDFKYRDVRQMVVNRARITRTRPRFDSWSLNFELLYDAQKIDVETIVNAIEYAGKYVGLCDSRPRYGQFAAIIKEIG